MSASLAYGGTTIALSADLYWTDENDWHPVEQTALRTVTGALVISSAQRTGGRPITLAPIEENSAWMTREQLDALRGFAAVAGREMVLTYRGVEYDVIFRHQDNGGIEAKPILHYSDTDETDWYLVTLRFMEI